MAKAQFPIDGKPGKDWKVTSYMGWRMHPIHKVKKHHNGTDIWSKHEPCWIEAPYDGKVIKVGNNPSGFGNYVIIRHVIKGTTYVTLYGHMKDGSIKVKPKQVIAAGTAIGKMGTTGASTGKHLHWELQVGKNWVWSDKGKGFIEPVKFFDNLIKFEASIASAPVEAKDTDPVAPAPTHDDKGAVEAAKAEKPAPSAPAPQAINYKALAKKVIRGDFGNGPARIKALKAKGLTAADIKKVQAEVNKLL
jgi:murein DD-endopeptidase MepM/ murein hydrolase activator NlpD